MRSAVKHKVMADTILDEIVVIQTAFNAAMDKLDADDDTAAALDVDYVSTQGITELDFDTVVAGQHKQNMRKTLRSSLAHKKLADEILDAVEELEATHNLLMTKLDAQAGTLASVDFVSALGVVAVGVDAVGSEAQHKASFRRSMRSAMKHKRLADQVLDNVEGLQNAMNLALAQLDVDGAAAAGPLLGNYVPFKVTVLTPDEV